MKQFFVMLALLSVMIPMILFLDDFTINNTRVHTVQRDADEAAAAAALLFDEEKYADGIWEFHDKEIVRYMNNVYKNQYHIILWIYDHSKGCRQYDNSESGECLHKKDGEIQKLKYVLSNISKDNSSIETPRLIVILERKQESFRGYENVSGIVRMSMYEIRI